MNVFETIKHRRSVRTFEETALRPEDAQKILQFAEKLENPFDLPITWKLLYAEKYGLSSPVIVGTNSYIAGKMRRAPHAEEAFGYMFEKVVLFAENLGVGTTWIAGTMNRDAFEKAMELAEGEVMPCVSPLGYPAKKMSLRETLMRKGVRADSRLDFTDLFFDGSFDRPLAPEASGKLADVLEAVRLAPSAVNKQPWRVVISDGNAHFYEKPGRGYVGENGWDLQKIDLGIAICHFDMIAEEYNLGISFEIKNPGIAVPGEVQYIGSFLRF